METFQDLSLPIPSRDQLYFIHQSTVPKSPSQGAGEGQASGGWIYWMWSLVWSWFWGPNVNLYDCLAAFFSADELKGDNMYRYDPFRLLSLGFKPIGSISMIRYSSFTKIEPIGSMKLDGHYQFFFV